MAVKPITMAPESIRIHADRRLAFQVLAAFGAKTDDESSNQVLEDQGNRKLVRFQTPIPFAGRTWVFTTTEWVTLKEPEQIDFELMPGNGPIRGGLKLLRDRFTLEDVEGCTRMTYESTFGIRWSWPGWLLGTVLFKGTMRSHMRKHLKEIRGTIESRAARSRLYPQRQDCPVTDA